MIVKNKKAEFEFEFDARFEAGIVLTSDDVKSIRKSTPSLTDTYAALSRGEVFWKNLVLSHSKIPDRTRKLLLNKKEIKKIIGLTAKASNTIVPIEMYEKKGLFKVLIGIGHRKSEIDKREKIKERDIKRRERLKEY